MLPDDGHRITDCMAAAFSRREKKSEKFLAKINEEKKALRLSEGHKSCTLAAGISSFPFYKNSPVSVFM